jgi:hypothetical protein
MEERGREQKPKISLTVPMLMNWLDLRKKLKSCLNVSSTSYASGTCIFMVPFPTFVSMARYSVFRLKILSR